MEGDGRRRGQARGERSCCADYSAMYRGKQQTVRVSNEATGPAAMHSYAG